MMLRLLLALTTLLLVGVNAAAAAEPVFDTSDVDRFYKLYDATGGRPTAEQLQQYIDEGSSDLRRFAQLRRTTGARIAEAIAKQPDTYVNARRCLGALPNVRQRVNSALTTFAELYPPMKVTRVTIVVGRGRPVGVTSAKDQLIVIGLEALCAIDWFNPNLEDRFVYVIAHEYAHLQQVSAIVDEDHPGVLAGSIMEGAAEFTGELISGGTAYARFKDWTKGREMEIETAFAADKDNNDLTKWLYNGKGTEEWLGDLGYWVGYRIVKSYYQRAPDKRQALRDILEMTDPKAFFAKSGWHPGIDLP